MVPFTPDTPGYIKNPDLESKIHCVAFVIDGSTADVMPEKILKQIKDLQIRMNQRGTLKIDRKKSNVSLPYYISLCIYRRYMAEILPIRRTTLYNHSIIL